MNSVLCFTVRFLDALPRFHGRGDDAGPEWPPSPLRFFQALVAASAGQWREEEFRKYPEPALKWLETISPLVVAPHASVASVGYRMYVPSNSGDLMTTAWARGDLAASMASVRVEKDVRPLLLNDGDAVHFLYTLTGGVCPYFDVLMKAVRSITHLGWGVDMAGGDARIITDSQAAELSGERWEPATEIIGRALRVPVAGTLQGLVDRYRAYLNRLSRDAGGRTIFKPVPSMTAFRVVHYRRATDVAAPAFQAFSILKPDGSDYMRFDPIRKTMIVAGMLRHAAGNERIARALGWTPEAAPGFIHGHGESRGEPHAVVTGPRLAYVPLPSIGSRGPESAHLIGGIRRALITVVGGESETRLRQIARLLSSAALEDEHDNGKEIALLSFLPAADPTVRRYTEASAKWSTVTPVILPGYDDPRQYRRRLRDARDANAAMIDAHQRQELAAKLDKRIEHLIRKSIRQAGFSEELAESARIQWQNAGFRPGTVAATKYAFPKVLQRFRRLHVRIGWQDAAGRSIEVPGPICLGAGRFVGLGLFAAEY